MQCTGEPSSQDWGGDQDAQTTSDSVLTEHQVTWAAQTWERHKTHTQPSLCPYGLTENLNLNGLDLGRE